MLLGEVPCSTCGRDMGDGGHYHCPDCGCTADGECSYGGWHDIALDRSGCTQCCQGDDDDEEVTDE